MSTMLITPSGSVCCVKLFLFFFLHRSVSIHFCCGIYFKLNSIGPLMHKFEEFLHFECIRSNFSFVVELFNNHCIHKQHAAPISESENTFFLRFNSMGDIEEKETVINYARQPLAYAEKKNLSQQRKKKKKRKTNRAILGNWQSQFWNQNIYIANNSSIDFTVLR